MKANLLMAMASFFILASLTYAAQSQGTENIIISNYSVTLTAGANATLGFNVTLVSGHAPFATTVSIFNGPEFANNGMTTFVTNSTGNPPFQGKLYVFTSPSTPIGTYALSLVGSTPNDTVNSAVLLIRILPHNNVTTSTSTTSRATTVSTTSSTVSTTSVPIVTTLATNSSPPQQNGIIVSQVLSNNLAVPIIIVVVVVIALALIFMRMRGGKPKSGMPGSPLPQPAPPSSPPQPVQAPSAPPSPTPSSPPSAPQQ
ncbi:MAG: hypothetical protein KGH72_02040 [Candidatus Micrarchaeota archaeon]|nr:hypothetical protein [Candidatus Micrarchaeota archaeon]